MTPLLITMMVGAAVGATVLVMALERNASYPIQDMRSVWVQKRVSPDIFKAFVQDPDTKSWNAWTFSSCHDYPITQEIQAGVTLCVLKYEERPGCMSVAKHNLGYILWRDSNEQPVLTAYPGQATPYCPSSPAHATETAEARAGR